MPIEIRHHVVDGLPGGAAVAIRDAGGEIDVYVSREHPLDRIAADLSVTMTALANAAYADSAVAS